MDIIHILTAISILLIGGTFVTILRWEFWLVRIFDFPRLQIGVSLILALLASIIIYHYDFWWQYLITILLILALFYQGKKIYRYTIFAPKQVLSYGGVESKYSISLMVSNVLQSNRNSEKLLEQVRTWNPDLLLILESDQWWKDKLDVLAKDYPYQIIRPQTNLYGMLLFSKLELTGIKVNFFFDNEVPSFEALVNIHGGNKIKIYCLHPKPPFPTESADSVERDAELLVVGRKVATLQGPVLIFGDFNDVAWSNTTRLFQKISKLLDPRIGRGFFNTFHAKYPLFRWSLDHVFHSTHFRLITMKRLKKMGSDHFPIFTKLQFAPDEQVEHVEPEADAEEHQQAKEKIDEAR